MVYSAVVVVMMKIVTNECNYSQKIKTWNNIK